MNKGLPNNIDAEKALIGSMFYSKMSLQKGCEEVEKEYFYLDSNAKIFEVIKELYTLVCQPNYFYQQQLHVFPLLEYYIALIIP